MFKIHQLNVYSAQKLLLNKHEIYELVKTENVNIVLGKNLGIIKEDKFQRINNLI